jgi:hypothetical protein
MKTVNASFDAYDEVAAAVDGLSDMGIASRDIDVVTQGRGPTMKTVDGAALGIAIGGVAGILAGFGLGVGWLVPVFLGVAAGGVAGGAFGWLNGTGPKGHGTNSPAGDLRRGATLVAARVHDDEAAAALAVLRRCGAIDTNTRRGEYAGDGWDGFVAKDIWDDDIGSEEAQFRDDSRDRRSTG